MFKLDGHVRKLQVEDVVIGTVLRRVDKEEKEVVSPFSDCIVIDVHDTKYDNGSLTWVTLARPYLYANTIGTSVGYLTGVEQYRVELKALLSYYSVVLMSTGKPATYNNQE